MQKQIYSVEWLNKIIRVIAVNSATEKDPDDFKKALLDYLRRIIFEMSPKFALEKENLEFLLESGHFEQDTSNHNVRHISGI